MARPRCPARPAHHVPLLGEPGVRGHHQGAFHPPLHCLLLEPLHLVVGGGQRRPHCGRGWTCEQPALLPASCPHTRML